VVGVVAADTDDLGWLTRRQHVDCGAVVLPTAKLDAVAVEAPAPNAAGRITKPDRLHTLYRGGVIKRVVVVANEIYVAARGILR